MANESKPAGSGTTETEQPLSESGGNSDDEVLARAQVALEHRRAGLRPEHMAKPLSSALTKFQQEMRDLSALAASDPEAAKELRRSINDEREARHTEQKAREQTAQRNAEAQIEKERQEFDHECRDLVATLPPEVRVYTSVEHDWLQRLALFDQTLPVFPGRPDDSGVTSQGYASATSHVPVWLLARTMLALQRDENREIWRPTIPEVQRRARTLIPWLSRSGDEVLRVARRMVGQPEPDLDPMIEWPEYDGESGHYLEMDEPAILGLP
jgi:hypothetical protein